MTEHAYFAQFYADERLPLKIVPRVSTIHAWTGRDWMTATQRWEARKARIRRNLGDDLIRRLTGVS